MSHRSDHSATSNVAQPHVSAVHWKTSNPVSRNSSRAGSKRTSIELSKISPLPNGHGSAPTKKSAHFALSDQDQDDCSDSGSDVDDMGDRRAAFYQPTDGKSYEPLLDKDDVERGRMSYDAASQDQPPFARPPFLTRRSTFRTRSPSTTAKLAARKKYTYAAFFLGLSLVSFTVQTETAVYIQHELGWNKAYCMLYFTHGSWSLLWPAQLLILRLQNWKMPWSTFWRRHVYILRSTAQMVEANDLVVPATARSPILYMLRMTILVTCALTVAGGSWYVAVNLTSASDLTAIYNCSAFFAYAFSVPMLREKLRYDKSFAVLVAIVGVLVVAYGDASEPKHGGKSGGAVGGKPAEEEPPSRIAGNLIIGIGSVLYGFYEVLYKKLACPPEGVSPNRGMIFANTFGALMGTCTLFVLWIPLPILHILGWETFELPTGKTAWVLLVSVLCNATFSGSFLVLISLTSPVLSSVAALLTIFLVAIVDNAFFGTDLSAAAISGGLMIIVAFLLLSYSTYREMAEENRLRKKEADLSSDECGDKEDDL